jgi:hypothetical protein
MTHYYVRIGYRLVGLGGNAKQRRKQRRALTAKEKAS